MLAVHRFGFDGSVDQTHPKRAAVATTAGNVQRKLDKSQ